MMARLAFDAIIAPCNTGHNEAFQADVRYLTQVGGFANEACVFFPAKGEPTCWVRADSQPAEWWQDMQNWVPDIRGSRCNWSENLATSIREHGLESGTVGVVGIGGTPRSPDGLILYGTLSHLEKCFPRARFLSATEPMAWVRSIKSEEEIAALEQATEIAEKMVQAASHKAREGVYEHEVYAEMVATLLRNRGELPTLILWGAGASPTRASRFPPIRALEKGDVIINETEARLAGYIAQVRRPIFLGPPGPEYEKLHDVALESFQKATDKLRPGVTFGELLRTVENFVSEKGYKALAVPLHGRGLGEDLPVIRISDTSPEIMGMKIQEGQVFVLGPRIGVPDGSKILAWGDTVAVTKQGMRRLGKLGMSPLIAD
ncbi:MAG TPA: M24 family metallopeptidase [Candidatus Binatia bacterium]|nr:M24 family metallopeptidase [Candidatus Binatia bacterium]